MNVIFPRFLKSAYRREPIASVLITMGIVDALIGGFGDSWSLFAVGLGTAGVSLVWRLWRLQQQQPLPEEQPSRTQLYLPSRSSSTALPMLTGVKKKPPH